ncbi:hypothetical protein Nmel_001218 [Mimus melanotis]
MKFLDRMKSGNLTSQIFKTLLQQIYGKAAGKKAGCYNVLSFGSGGNALEAELNESADLYRQATWDQKWFITYIAKGIFAAVSILDFLLIFCITSAHHKKVSSKSICIIYRSRKKKRITEALSKTLYSTQIGVMEDLIFMAYTAEKEEEKNHHSGRQRRFMSTAKHLTQTQEKTIRFLLKNEVIKALAFYLQHRLYFLCAGKTWKVKLAVLGMVWAALAGQ